MGGALVVLCIAISKVNIFSMQINPAGICSGKWKRGTTAGSAYLKKMTPKIRRTITIEISFFSELVILEVKRNGAISEADGYYTCLCWYQVPKPHLSFVFHYGPVDSLCLLVTTRCMIPGTKYQ